MNTSCTKFNLLAKFPKKAFATLFFSCLTALLLLCVPYCFVRVIDSSLSTQSLESLWLWLSLAVGAQLSASLLGYFARVWAHDVSCEKAHEIRCKAYSHVENATIMELHSNHWTDLSSKIAKLSESTRSFYDSILTTGAQFGITLVGTLGVLATLYWPLACCAILPVPFLCLFFVRYQKTINPSSRGIFKAQVNYNNHLYSSIAALDTIQAAGLEKRFETQFQEISQELLDKGKRHVRLLGKQAPILDASHALLLILVMGGGGVLALQGKMTIGVLVGFVMYAPRVFSSIRSGASLYQSYQQYMVGKQYFSVVLKLNPKVPNNIIRIPSGLKLTQVHFSWANRKILNNISLSLNPSEHLAILAPSGSGKTTLAYCMLGLYPLESGEIGYAWDCNSKNIGYVAQEPNIFPTSLRENIELISGKLNDDTLKELISCAGLESIMDNLPQGLETQVGPSAQRLSGGEAKRVALARALATKPKLLIIDQLTSDLEIELCKRIFTKIQEFNPSMSIIYLGHRKPEGLTCCTLGLKNGCLTKAI